jgi:hypothetical protein
VKSFDGSAPPHVPRQWSLIQGETTSLSIASKIPCHGHCGPKGSIRSLRSSTRRRRDRYLYTRSLRKQATGFGSMGYSYSCFVYFTLPTCSRLKHWRVGAGTRLVRQRIADIKRGSCRGRHAFQIVMRSSEQLTPSLISKRTYRVPVCINNHRDILCDAFLPTSSQLLHIPRIVWP